MKQASPNREIVAELYRALVLFGAGNDLLGIVGSWGDSLPDTDVLSGLRAWNAGTIADIKGRIEHYEMSCPHPACNQDERPQTLRAAQ